VRPPTFFKLHCIYFRTTELPLDLVGIDRAAIYCLRPPTLLLAACYIS
jgi:hypothetical protein